MKVFIALVILGFGAAAFGGLKTYLDNRAAASALQEGGIEADAHVSSVTEVSGRRIETYHKISVSFDPQGPLEFGSAEIQDCSGHRYESGTGTVRIVYAASDPDTVRLAACRSSFDSDILPGIVGVAFLAVALLLLWRTRGLWTS
jgi:hypothetical protein